MGEGWDWASARNRKMRNGKRSVFCPRQLLDYCVYHTPCSFDVIVGSRLIEVEIMVEIEKALKLWWIRT